MRLAVLKRSNLVTAQVRRHSSPCFGKRSRLICIRAGGQHWREFLRPSQVVTVDLRRCWLAGGTGTGQGRFPGSPDGIRTRATALRGPIRG